MSMYRGSARGSEQAEMTNQLVETARKSSRCDHRLRPNRRSLAQHAICCETFDATDDFDLPLLQTGQESDVYERDVLFEDARVDTLGGRCDTESAEVPD